jgi:two-component system, OmpR family, KDP operon response regulator KdpE
MTSEAGQRILIVDDERAIRRLLRVNLSSHGYNVSEAINGQEALANAVAGRPDLIILDLGLPDMEGIEVIRQVREWSQVPILVLSVREGEKDKVAALNAGADDYLTKPFGTEELQARVRVALRRAAPLGTESIFQVGGLTVNLARRQVLSDQKEISLTPTEYDLLRLLVQNSGKVLTHRQILLRLWGETYENEIHLLRVNMSNLRQKIEPDPSRPRYIITEPGVGYRLRIP